MSGWLIRFLIGGFLDGRPGMHQRKLDRKSGSFSGFGFEAKLSVVEPGDDIVGDGESLASSFAYVFGSEKRFKNPFSDFIWNTGSGVGDLDGDEILAFSSGYPDFPPFGFPFVD